MLLELLKVLPPRLLAIAVLRLGVLETGLRLVEEGIRARPNWGDVRFAGSCRLFDCGVEGEMSVDIRRAFAACWRIESWSYSTPNISSWPSSRGDGAIVVVWKDVELKGGVADVTVTGSEAKTFEGMALGASWLSASAPGACRGQSCVDSSGGQEVRSLMIYLV